MKDELTVLPFAVQTESCYPQHRTLLLWQWLLPCQHQLQNFDENGKGNKGENGKTKSSVTSNLVTEASKIKEETAGTINETKFISCF